MTDSSDHWYARLGFGIELGPMPRCDLDELAQTRQLLINDSVREGTDGEWFPARDLDGLFTSDERGTEVVSPSDSSPTGPVSDDPEEPESVDAVGESTESADDLPETTPRDPGRDQETALPLAQSLDEFEFDTGPSASTEDVSNDAPIDTRHPLARTCEDAPAIDLSPESEDQPEVEPSRPTELEKPASDTTASVNTEDMTPAVETGSTEVDRPTLPDPLAPVANRQPFPDFPDEERTDSSAQKESLLPDPLAPLADRDPFPDFPDEKESDMPAPVIPPPVTAIPAATDSQTSSSAEFTVRSLPPIRLPVPSMVSLIRLAIAAAVVVGLWELFSGGAEPDIYAEYSAIYSELREHQNNPPNPTEWMAFAEQARSRIDESNVWLEETADPGDREKNLLLYAGRDMQELLNADPDAESPHQERLDGFFRQLSEIYGAAP